MDENTIQNKDGTKGIKSCVLEDDDTSETSNDCEVIVPIRKLYGSDLFWKDREFDLVLIDDDENLKEPVEINNVVFNGPKDFFNLLRLINHSETEIHQDINKIVIKMKAVDPLKKYDLRYSVLNLVKEKLEMIQGKNVLSLSLDNYDDFAGEMLSMYSVKHEIKKG
jgi:hypothetical protein